MPKTSKKTTTNSEAKVINMRLTDEVDGFLLNVKVAEQNNWNRPANQTYKSSPYTYLEIIFNNLT